MLGRGKPRLMTVAQHLCPNCLAPVIEHDLAGLVKCSQLWRKREMAKVEKK